MAQLKPITVQLFEGKNEGIKAGRTERSGVITKQLCAEETISELSCCDGQFDAALLILNGGVRGHSEQKKLTDWVSH